MSVSISPAMQKFIDYFGNTGPRWGLSENTCRVHALLYLAAAPVSASELAHNLAMSDVDVDLALQDLNGWRMGSQQADGSWLGVGEPWQLLFTALEERRRREMQPVLDMLDQCSHEAQGDGHTPQVAVARMRELKALMQDVAALDFQALGLSSGRLTRLVQFGGKAARMLERIRQPGRAR